MEAIDKAKQLVDKMSGDTYEDSINNALVAVDEILDLDYFSEEGREYWYEVKVEVLLILNSKYSD